MDPLEEVVREIRSDAETFRAYGADRLATACERHADLVEAAIGARWLASVTLEEAVEIGGYSYSHLQHLVADGTIENVGTKGAPRIRRSDVPVKPGHGRRPDGTSKGEILVEDVVALRGREAGS